MRVLHVLEATLGGTGRHVLDLLEGLAAEGGEFDLHLAYATRRADPRFTSRLPAVQAAGVHCFGCDMHREIHPPSDAASLLRISRYARRHGIEIIHGHSAKGGYLGRLATRLVPKTRSVYTPNSSPFRMGILYHGLEVTAGALFTDLVIAVSPSERAELIANHAAPSSRIRLIPNGIPDTGPPAPHRHSGKAITVGTLGRLTPQKAPLRFLDLAQAIRALDPKIQFLWVGDGELRSEWDRGVAERRLESNVRLDGWRTDIEAALAEMDIFLMVSDYEGAPYALLEAMRAKLPCLVTDVPGSRDTVVHEQTGFIIPRHDTSQQAGYVLRLAHNESLRSRLGQSGWNRWKETYTLDRMVESTRDIYLELLKS